MVQISARGSTPPSAARSGLGGAEPGELRPNPTRAAGGPRRRTVPRPCRPRIRSASSCSGVAWSAKAALNSSTHARMSRSRSIWRATVPSGQTGAATATPGSRSRSHRSSGTRSRSPSTKAWPAASLGHARSRFGRPRLALDLDPRLDQRPADPLPRQAGSTTRVLTSGMTTPASGHRHRRPRPARPGRRHSGRSSRRAGDDDPASSPASRARSTIAVKASASSAVNRRIATSAIECSSRARGRPRTAARAPRTARAPARTAPRASGPSPTASWGTT